MNTSVTRKLVSLTAVVSLTLAFGLPVAQAQEGGHGAGHGAVATPVASTRVQGMGSVKKVMADKKMIKLTHDPIAALGWPAMTMNFTVAPAVSLAGYKAGQAVHFTLEKQANGSYLITEMMSMDGMQH